MKSTWLQLASFFSTISFSRFQFTPEIKREIRNGTYQNDTPVTRSQSTVPVARTRWFYATDVPLSKPDRYDYKPVGKAKTFVPFTVRDSQRLDAAYEQTHQLQAPEASETPLGASGACLPPHVIPVNEDHLFQVDIRKRTLSPVYWDGAVYEVRRGLWFGSDGVPLDDDTTEGLEKGYAKLKPFLFRRSLEKHEKEMKERMEKAKQGKTGVADGPAIKRAKTEAEAPGLKPKVEAEAKSPLLEETTDVGLAVDVGLVTDHRGAEKDLYCLDNAREQVVIYLDATNAVLLPDSFRGTFQLKLLRELSAPPMIGVMRITRGFREPEAELSAAKKAERDAQAQTSLVDSIAQEIPPIGTLFGKEMLEIFGGTPAANRTVEEADKNENAHLKHQMEKDFDTKGDVGQREVDHLVFCVHGIGQVLGTKYELVDFTHSINMMRKTLKSVYKLEPRFQQLGRQSRDQAGHLASPNCRIQVLPIQWRHKVDFSTKKASRELGEDGEPRLPSLAGITVDGVQSLRNVLGDVVLDILLYYEPHYIQQIMHEVVSEMNAVYDQFLARNPSFTGKVSIMGHSLGSSICFDILAQQPRGSPTGSPTQLKFDVENFFAIGSPVGVFKLLKRCNISSRALHPVSNPFVLAPKCNHLYNIYHPCDPVGYRMEPLIATEFARYKAEPIRSALTPSALSTHLKDVVSFSEGLTAKVAEKASNVWSFAASSSKAEPLLDMLNAREEERKAPMEGMVSPKALAKITKCNANGRVDYVLPTGLFDISLVSALAAHVTYFEDVDVAGFMLQELLKEKEVVLEKRVRVVQK